MKATVDNLLDKTLTPDDIEFKFDWILLKSLKKNTYDLIFSETTFYPEYFKICSYAGNQVLLDKTKGIWRGPIYKKMIEELRAAVDKWFTNHGIDSWNNIFFSGESPEAIKNDVEFSKILPYVDPTKMEAIEI